MIKSVLLALCCALVSIAAIATASADDAAVPPSPVAAAPAAPLMPPMPAAPLMPVAPEVYHRTAFIGDSFTDGYSYPQLVRDSLAAQELPPMIAINAGIGGNPIMAMRTRLDRDVLAFHPTMVVICSGGGPPPDEYESNLDALVARLTSLHIPVILVTPSIMGPRNEARLWPLVPQYSAGIVRVAAKYSVPVADVVKFQRQDFAAGHAQICADDLHPNYEGQRMIARAVLEAMGYPNVPVLQRANVKLDPGVIREWKVRALDAKEVPITDTSELLIKPDRTWNRLKVPQPSSGIAPDNVDALWLDDACKQGVVVNLDKSVPSASGRYVVVTNYKSKKDQTLQLHVGAELEKVWINGKPVYAMGGEWRGWHPGRESVAVHLNKGDNTIVAQVGTQFYASITDGPMW